MDNFGPIRAVLTVVLFFTVSPVLGATTNWPQWRGPEGTGSAAMANPPLEWSESKNIRFKTPLSGLGHSTPIVWNDTIFLTTGIPIGDPLPPRFSGRSGAHDNLPVTHRYRFQVIAVNRNNGSILWQKAVQEALPVEGAHRSASLASNSPVTDGKHVYAFFGSYGIYCLNFQGDLIWKKALGVMHTKHGHGEGASPALFEDTLFINWDHEGQSFLIALDKNTGKVKWQHHRDEVTSWSSPIVIEHRGRSQLIVCGTNRIRGYEIETGKTIWECGGLSANIVATPVYSDGILYAGSSYEKRAFLAINVEDAAGDITDSKHIIWSRFRGTPYVPSPLLYGDAIYFLTHYQGILTRLQAKTGEDSPGAFRLGGIRNVYASPVAAAGRVYITDLDGLTMVISHEEIPRLLSANQLDEPISASAALSGDMILLRGKNHLYGIGE